MSLGYARMKRIGKGAGRALAYKERRGDDFTAGAFEAPQRILRPGGLFRLVFPAHSPFCMHLSETQRRRQTQRKSAKIS